MTTIVTEVGSSSGGRFQLTTDNDLVAATAHWPYDRSIDEWIDIAVEVPVHALRDSLKDGSQPVTARSNGKSIAFLVTADATMLVTLVSRNSLGPIELQFRLDSESASKVQNHLRQLAL